MFEKKLNIIFYTFSPHTEQKEEESREFYSLQGFCTDLATKREPWYVSGCSVT